MSDDPNKVTYFGLTDFRNERKRFGIKNKDRARHMYVIGKTGMGKSTILENIAVQDIQNGEGLCFLDPHGSAIETLLEYIPEHRIKDVVYFAPFDSEYPIAFNVMEDVDPDKRHLVASGLMSTFKKIWVDAWSARMEYILNNTILALLEYPGSTLLSVNRMLSDKAFRQEVVRNVTDSSVRSFWVDEFANYTERMQAESVPAIQNKVGQFTSNPIIRNIIGQPKSSFNLREMMDNKKIFLVNLSKGQIGEQNAALLGGMIVTAIYLGAMSRADVPKHELAKLPNFYLFVDEFQNFANDSFADILSEARKYKLALTVAHQYIAQMEETVADAVFGNVGTTIAYRVGPMDGETLEKIFAPTFTQEDVVSLGRFQFYISLMIDEVGSKPFSAVGLPPLPKPEVSFRTQVIDASRAQFAFPRESVKQVIDDWHSTQYKTDRDLKQNEKREKKFGEKTSTLSKSSKNQTSDQSLPPSKIIIPPEIQNILPQQLEKTLPDTEDSLVFESQELNTDLELNKIKITHPSSSYSTKSNNSLHEKNSTKETKNFSFKPKTPTPLIQKSSIKEFLNSVQNTQSVPDISEIEEVKPSVSSKHFGKKEASEENKNALKEALLRAMKKKDTEETSSEKISSQTFSTPSSILKRNILPEVKQKVSLQNIPPKKENKQEEDFSLSDLLQQAEIILEQYGKVPENSFDTKIHTTNYAYKGVKEVPEDVLRSILNS